MSLRKTILYGIAFVSGAVVLALEIAAGRFLQVKFGSAIHVWGNLIAVVLAGLSGGYYLGGHLADRRASFVKLGVLLLVSAVLLLSLRFYAYRVCTVIVGALGMESVGTVGPLLASLALFFVPTTALGTVSPYAVRLLADDPAKLGRQVGALYAVSTLGSIIGALGTTYYLILWVGTRETFILLGAIQALLAFTALGYGLRLRSAAGI